MNGCNPNNPATKRILQEIRELKNDTNPDYKAYPLEDNIFEWHFTIRGPQDSDFSGGIYHGRIILPSDYPFKPPNIVLLTPNGRFQEGVKICLTVSAHHPEHWQPSWSIRTVLVALIGFMPTEGKGAIGAIDIPSEDRKELAKKSLHWKCTRCGSDNSTALPEPSKDNTSKTTTTTTTTTTTSSVTQSNTNISNVNTNSNNNNNNNNNNNIDEKKQIDSELQQINMTTPNMMVSNNINMQMRNSPLAVMNPINTSSSNSNDYIDKNSNGQQQSSSSSSSSTNNNTDKNIKQSTTNNNNNNNNITTPTPIVPVVPVVPAAAPITPIVPPAPAVLEPPQRILLNPSTANMDRWIIALVIVFISLLVKRLL